MVIPFMNLSGKVDKDLKFNVQNRSRDTIRHEMQELIAIGRVFEVTVTQIISKF